MFSKSIGTWVGNIDYKSGNYNLIISKNFNINFSNISLNKFHIHKNYYSISNFTSKLFPRNFNSVHKETFTTTTKIPEALSVLSWNLLAEANVSKTWLPYVADEHLNWDNRKENIVNHVLEINPDIFCAQEVEKRYYDEYFEPRLTVAGYTGVYKKRPNTRVDGLALFYKTNKFNLKAYHDIDFNVLANKFNDSKYLVDRIALLSVLESTESDVNPQKFLIASTHIWWDREAYDIQYGQVDMLVNEVEQIAEKENLPVVVCGDFNTFPGSSLYHHLSGSKLKLHSAYNHYSPDGSIPITQFSSKSGLFVCVDYIWFSSKHWKISRLLDLPDASIRPKTLPAKEWPSDHFSIACELVPASTFKI